MALLAIWVDREHAKLFRYSSENLTQTHFTANTAPNHHEGQLDHLKKEVKFFKEFTPSLLGATEILILGPGVAKHHFRTFLTEHHPDLARKIVGCETIGHPSEAQIIEHARQFFSAERLSAVKV